MCEELTKELKVSMVGMGSDAHMQAVFDKARSAQCFRKRGSKVKLGKWQSWFNVAQEWQGFKSCYLLALLHLGTTRGWRRTSCGILAGRLRCLCFEK